MKDIFEIVPLSREESVIASHPGFTPVLRRYFLHDAAEAAAIPAHEGAVSHIIQPPLHETETMVWLWLVDAPVEYDGKSSVVRENGLTYIWTGGIESVADGVYRQTEEMMAEYAGILSKYGAEMMRDCQRTWFFVQDIDNNYADFVEARKAFFAALPPCDHFIASTGIDGAPAAAESYVMLDAYAVIGLSENDRRFLYAPENLNPPSEYGVTFERGTLLKQGDAERILISGTASINNRGQIVHEGDVAAQTERTLDNITVLLSEAGSDLGSIRMALVYMRNAEDSRIAEDIFLRRCPSVPYVVLLAPVCRPGWLVEIECLV